MDRPRMIKGEPVFINGDGETSRDFCYVDNAVQANLLAATRKARGAQPGLQRRRWRPHHASTSLFGLLRDNLAPTARIRRASRVPRLPPRRRPPRLADFGKAQPLLGYAPTHQLGEGLAEAIPWYVGREKCMEL